MHKSAAVGIGFLLLLFALWLSPIAPLSFKPNPVDGQIVCTVPNNFVNGAIADATQVNADFTALTGCFTNTPTPLYPNILYNGVMQFDQAHSGSSISLSNAGTTYTIDGWLVNATTQATGLTAQRVAWSQTLSPASQFVDALQVTIGTGNSTVNAGDAIAIVQRIEGIQMSNTAFGTSAARTLTLSFCLMSNVANANVGVGMHSGTNDHAYVQNVQLGSANTPVCSHITIPGDTAGTWPINGSSLGGAVHFAMEAGTSSQQSAGIWAGTTQVGTSAQTQFSQTTGAWLQVTGVKLEISPTATPFVLRDLTSEFAMIGRYYQKSYDGGVTPGAATFVGASRIAMTQGANAAAVVPVYFSIPMRCDPTITLYSPNSGTSGKAYDSVNSADVTATALSVGNNSFAWQATPSAGAATAIQEHWTADCRL